MNKLKTKAFIDFSIIKNSNVEELRTELSYLIGVGMVVVVWDKVLTLDEMLINTIEKGVSDLIYDYRIKDSSSYDAVDYIIDPDEKLVNKFKNNLNINGIVLEKL